MKWKKIPTSPASSIKVWKETTFPDLSVLLKIGSWNCLNVEEAFLLSADRALERINDFWTVDMFGDYRIKIIVYCIPRLLQHFFNGNKADTMAWIPLG